jgi:rubredoxin
MTNADAKVYKKYMCLICGFVYDEAAGLPDEGIAPGTKWEDIPINWTCPECGARKEDFEMVEI